MPRLFLSNFDFESGLSGSGGQTSRADLARNADLAWTWLAVAQPDDALLLPEGAVLPPGLSDHLARLGRRGVKVLTASDRPHPGDQPVPWGWSPAILRQIQSLGLKASPPDLSAVRTANRRSFSVQMELDWGCGPDGLVLVRRMDEVQAALSRLDRWLIKAEYGAAGRERLSGEGSELKPAQQNWIERRLKRDGCVCVEPILDRESEAGLQWEIPLRGVPCFRGIVPLESDERGQYSGSRFTPAPDLYPLWREAIDVTGRAVRALQRIGYHGPVGIDAMRYRTSTGQIRIRPLQDINARWTMGRISLGWRHAQIAETGGLMRIGSQADLMSRQSTTAPLRITPATPSEQTSQHVIWLEPDHTKG